MRSLFLFILLLPFTGFGQTVSLVKDINAEGNSLPRALYAFQDKLYFNANDGVNGFELWVSDGTESGTFMLKDINPGSSSSSPDDFITYKNKIYFRANNQLWVTDGTETGTQLIADVEFSAPVIIYNDSLYFEGNEELWVTDGTNANTKLRKDIDGDPNDGSSLSEFILFDNKLFMTSNNGTWVVDNDRVYQYSTEEYRTGVVFKDTLFVSGLSNSTGLYYFLQGSNSPRLLKTITPFSFGDDINEFESNNNYILFPANDGSNGTEPWVSDASEDGTNILLDINTSSSQPQDFKVLENEFYFSAEDENGNRELFRSDGTSDGTAKINVSSGASGLDPTDLVIIGNKLYFSGNTAENGREPLYYNPFETLTLLDDINSGSGNSGPEFFTRVNNTVFFRATGPEGNELYKYDDPCLGVSCPTGEVCVQGICVDPCATVNCPPDQTCDLGICVPSEDPCNSITCPDDEKCYEGVCLISCSETAETNCFDFGPNLVAPAGVGVVLTAGDGFDVYIWSTGETTQSILAAISGRYFVEAYNLTTNSYHSDTVDVLIECEAGSCPPGQTCRDGYCFTETNNPCDGITCPTGESCYEGGCYPDCVESTCESEDICYVSNCYVEAECENIECSENDVCYQGSCFDTCDTSSEGNCYTIGPDQVASAGAQIVLTAGDGYDLYIWSTGETTQSILAGISGQYVVQSYNFDSQTYHSDTVNILIGCNAGSCPPGQICRDGYCFSELNDPCDGITCPTGESCYEGVCYPDCVESTCENEDICYVSNCYMEAECENVQCAENDVCYQGSCFDTCDTSSEGNCYTIGPDQVASPNAQIVLTAGDGYDLYIWSTGETTQSILAGISGQYVVQSYNFASQTYHSDTVNILIGCNAGSCPPGQTCRDGYCFSELNDPCDGITCPTGESCYEGVCYPDCVESTCESEDICYLSNCYESSPCDDIVCPQNETCIEGLCFASVTGVIESGIFKGLNIYPNPSSGLIQIESPRALKNVTIEVHTLLGRSIYSSSMEILGQQFKLNLAEEGLNGLILITIKSDDEVINRVVEMRN